MQRSQIELGSLLEQAKRESGDDPQLAAFLEELMEFEKGNSFRYKDEIRALLSKHVASQGERKRGS